MKKLGLLLTIILLVGCGKQSNLDLSKIKADLSNLTYNDTKMFADTCADMELVKDKYGLDTTNIEESIICIPKTSTTSSMYAIFLIKNEEGEKAADKFIENYKASWMMDYLPEEKKLVEDMSTKKDGNYRIYVVSHDNQKVLNIIK